MNELLIIDKWLTGKLLGLPALTAVVGQQVYSEVAPPGTSLPYLIFKLVSQEPILSFNSKTIGVNADYDVKLICEGESFLPIADAEQVVYTALDRSTGVVAEGIVFSCVRVGLIKYPEVDEASGVQYRHLGGQYRIQVQGV